MLGFIALIGIFVAIGRFLFFAHSVLEFVIIIFATILSVLMTVEG